MDNDPDWKGNIGKLKVGSTDSEYTKKVKSTKIRQAGVSADHVRVLLKFMQMPENKMDLKRYMAGIGQYWNETLTKAKTKNTIANSLGNPPEKDKETPIFREGKTMTQSEYEILQRLKKHKIEDLMNAFTKDEYAVVDRFSKGKTITQSERELLQKLNKSKIENLMQLKTVKEVTEKEEVASFSRQESKQGDTKQEEKQEEEDIKKDD